jgi:cellulose synthase/poly-beta-1,6-N-acetylglucosamine synthase-like glycosyltransferase
MGTLISSVLVLFAALLAIPVLLFCLEILAALIVPQREFAVADRDAPRRRVAVLVPAHDESTEILDTLGDIKKQLEPGDRLLVVADNCTDDTAAIARAAGTEVTERDDRTRIGKGYALAWGLQHLKADPPGVVIMIDADCRLANDTLKRLATVCAATKRPAQALYLMSEPAGSPIDYRVAVFAFRVKNWVRPLGLRALNLPCQLMGTGMAFPWEIIGAANWATGAGVEDIKLGLELARAGHPPVLCPSAGVNSQFPMSSKGAGSQRKRWEQGHLGVMVTTIPGLIYKSLAHGNFALLALALDLAVPPLTLLGMLVSLMLLISGFAVLFGLPSTALTISAANLSAYTIAVMLCWLKFGRDILPLSSISSVATYAIDKLPLYRQIVSRNGNSEWIRTDRKKVEGDRN